MNYRKYLPWIILGVIILLAVWMYNSLVSNREEVNGKWANVEVQYQRRADLIPNLVETVKGYANFEKSTLTEITQLRASVGQAKANFDDKNLPVDERVKAANTMESSLSRLLVIVEQYPDLKAGQNFRDLHASLEGTENRVGESRRQYNEAVKAYNKSRLSFPRNMFANIFGFTAKPYFGSEAGSEKAPKVEFQ